ncbi:hypothetical protein [Salipiger sp.]|uniref:hypothetical protein n=1 Tax=Salipiger sp. TaxID=2078585 RepID=UPI003A97EA58
MAMVTDQDIAPHVARLETLFEERLALRRGGFEARAAKAARALPRLLRRDLARVVEAQRLSGHPRLARTVDTAEVKLAADRVAQGLKAIDPADRRRGRLLGMLGALMFNLALLFAAVVIVLVWRGYL